MNHMVGKEISSLRRGRTVLIAVAMLAGVAGCVVEGEPSAESTTMRPPTTTVQVAAPTSAPAIAPPVATTTAVAPPTSPAAAAPAAIMPGVVCMNLQEAQDTIQAAGVFFSRSADASGQGRAQVMDRNWTVVGQEPAPGVAVGEGEAVLSVVKNGEPSQC
ncbi:hypothetical protein QX204_30910 [Nocardia sp. PE-7]|nr:hypothetical protein [Nocardia sp. PE-7]WKG09380.1 hypothetical protein QX204_30910 [Nocardia sp. PE-7]